MKDQAGLGVLARAKVGEPVWADSLGVWSSGLSQTAPHAPVLQCPLLGGSPTFCTGRRPRWAQASGSPESSQARGHLSWRWMKARLWTCCRHPQRGPGPRPPVIFGRPPLVLSDEMSLTTECWCVKSLVTRGCLLAGAPQLLEALPNLPLWTGDSLR